ncbi:MAG: GNAT family N-acetyltransferase, partial [Anaerolineae bacterium]
DLVVSGELRGLGIGTALLDELICLAQQLGSKTVEIGARVNNTRAIALYERVGFVPNRTINLRFSTGVEDIVYLRKSIE